MPRKVQLQLLRTTIAALNTVRDANGLFIGEAYYVTDEQRIAIASAINSYRTLVKREGDTMTGKLIAAAATSALAGFQITPGIKPATPGEGDIWATLGDMFYHLDGVTRRIPSEGTLPQTDDLIVNGDFWYNEPADTWLGGGANPIDDFICDQWHGRNTTDATVTMARSTATPYASIYGTPSQLLINATTADSAIAASQQLSFWQCLEPTKLLRLGFGYVISNRPDIYVRFTLVCNRAGTYHVACLSGDKALSYVAPFVVEAADVDKPVEHVIRIPAPPTGGNWNTAGKGAYFFWTFTSGATYHSASPNAWVTGERYATAAATNALLSAGFRAIVTDVAIGQTVSTDAGLIVPPYRRKTQIDAIDEVRRYYRTIFTMWSGDVTAAGTYYATETLPAPMAAVPTINWMAGSQSSIFPVPVAPPAAQTAGITFVLQGTGSIAIREGRKALATPATVTAGYFYSTLGLNARI